MEKQQILTRTLAVIVIIASVIPLTAGDQKESNCCVRVSTSEIKDPIISYELQYPKYPCVKAVILRTDKGSSCVSWRKSWVWKKLCNFDTKGGSICTDQARSWAQEKFPKFLPQNKLATNHVVQNMMSTPPSSISTPSQSSISNFTDVERHNINYSAEKANTCCKSVSSNAKVDPIIGYELQHPDPPCVKAVILKTERGKFCNRWTKSSVWKKICNFETNGTSISNRQARSWAQKTFPTFLPQKNLFKPALSTTWRPT